MILTTLYKKDKKGKQQVWSIEVVGKVYRSSEGYVGGAITTTKWTETNPTNVGRANHRTSFQQALFEAEAKVKKQKNKGWNEDIHIDEVIISPMLAHKFNDHREYVLGKEGVATQPKLDGIRCIATIDGLFTRNGKPIVAAPHIWDEVKKILDKIPEAMLDGELYNHELKNDFNTITSIVRKQKLSEDDLTRSKMFLQYHIYDIIIPGSFASRFSVLDKHLNNKSEYLKLVDTVFLPVKGNQNLLDRFYGEYLEAGYEGQMIRIPSSTYQGFRTKDLLKRKEFLDEEFEIIDIEEGVGNRSGMMGRVKFKTKAGKTFDSNARGTHEYFRHLLNNKSAYIGLQATVRYQNLTPDGIPRFPVMIDIPNDK